MALKVDDPRDVQGAYDKRFDHIAQREYDDEFKKIIDAENMGADTDLGDRTKDLDDLGDDVRNRENTSGAWENNVSGNQQQQGGIRGALQKAKVLFKKRGAIAAIVALLGGGAAVPFLGSASLPFSIIGNMDAKSQELGLGQYDTDAMNYMIFSGKGSVSTTDSKIKGLYDSEISQLKENGVTLNGGKKNPVTGKTTFTSVTFEGQTYHAGTEFTNAMDNSSFHQAMVFNKGSYWKSAKSSFAAKVKSLFKIDPNPDISGSQKEEDKKLLTESIEGSDSTASGSGTQEEKDPKTGVDPNAAEKASATALAGDLQGEITAEQQALENGDISTTLAANSNNGDLGQALGREGTNLADDAEKGIGGKVWGYVNALGPVDTMCTIYNVANTANVLARTVALFNIVRFALTIRATIEKAKAGDDNGQSVQYLMDLIQQKDPTTGQSFDETSYAAFLFDGQLSSEPSSVSAIGGQAMLALYMTMHAVNGLFGQVAKYASLGFTSGGAGEGRRFLKSVCSYAQNVGIQIAATVGSFVVGLFSGGSTIAGEEGIMASIKLGFQSAIKTVTESIGKDAIKSFLQKQGEKIGEDGLLRYAAKSSWSSFTKLWGTMDTWSKVGLLAAGASAFGMGYIVDTLAGGNVAGMLKNGFSAFMGLGTGWDHYETVNGIASGGDMATYSQAAAYQPTQQKYEDAYVADMQLQAKNTPFDLKNPYSMIGSAMFGIQKTIGVSASLSLPSTLLSVASLPFNLPSMFAAHADSQPTPQQIGDQVQDPFYQDNNIAVTVTGNTQVVFQKNYSFQDIIDKLVDVPNPQVAYSGDDPTTGEPELSIVPGSDLDNYAQMCHNPDRTEADPEFANDDGSNTYDINTCIPGSANYKSEYALYDDAIRFIGQVSPDSSDTTTASTTTSTGAGTSGRDDVPAKFKQMATACLQADGGKHACGDGSVWLGMEPGQCASFAAWRVAQQWYGSLLQPDGSNLEQLVQSKPIPGFYELALGNGNQVAPNLIAHGIADPVKSLADTQPGDIVSMTTKNPAGHVYVIISNNNGDITVEDYNDIGGPGKYGTQDITGSTFFTQSSVVAIARVHKGGGAQ